MLDNVFEILRGIFSGGFTQDGFTITSKSPCRVEISYSHNSVHIDFVSNPPSVKFLKDMGIITPSIEKTVTGIEFGPKSGTIKLKNFIDIPFNYE